MISYAREACSFLKEDLQMKGYNGKILRVDLTTGTSSVVEPPEDYYKHYLGGRGFIIHTLLTEVPKGADPLGPDNRLIFALGPITGHPLPGSGRNSIGAKSPLTGGFGECEVGGYWGAALKRAGYDAIIFEGTSPQPVYLWINDGHVEIRDATRLWGMEIADTEKALKEELNEKGVRTAIIGPQVSDWCVMPVLQMISLIMAAAPGWARLWVQKS